MYARIVKKTTSSAGDESFKILSGETVLYTSPSLVNNQERSLDVCLPATTNNVYTLHMYDKTVTSWSDGAWIIIYGVNGNQLDRNDPGSDDDASFRNAILPQILHRIEHDGSH